MAGPSPSATIVNQTKVELPLLSDLLPRVPRGAAEAVRRGLAKSAVDRFPSCAEMAHEILAEIPKSVPVEALESETAMLPGVSLCPTCYVPIPLAGMNEGDRVKCESCQATAVLRLSGRFPILSPAGPTPARSATAGAPPRSTANDAGLAATMAMHPGRAEPAVAETQQTPWAGPSARAKAATAIRRPVLVMVLPVALLVLLAALAFGSWAGAAPRKTRA